MATKRIYDVAEDYIWCRKARRFTNDCEDDESAFIWANWSQGPPGFPYVDYGPCFIPVCFPWEIDDIVYDQWGKWRVYYVATETVLLIQYDMYDCHPSEGRWYKYFFMEYEMTSLADVEFLEGPGQSDSLSVIVGGSRSMEAFGLKKPRFHQKGFF